MVFALVGNQNCGKTTLFNQLTGSNQHVGNFPGVTVESKNGTVKGHKDCTVVDLPGIYSLRPYSAEENVTRDFIIDSKPDAIINILDATNIERNLYLTLQLSEMDIPMVLALNMMDEVRNNGGTINIDELSKKIGMPVIPISASKNEGITELIETVINIAENKIKPERTDFCKGAVHRCIHAVRHQIEDHAENSGLSLRFASAKIVEGDTPIIKRLKLNDNELELMEHSIVEMESEIGMDRNAALAEMRYSFIEKLCAETVVKSKESKEHKRSVRIDSILTNKFLAIPLFIAIMLMIFWLTFGVIGAFLSDLMEIGIDWLTNVCDNALTDYGINSVVHSLIIDGVFAGVGAVLSFLPVIVVLFFFLSILEDSGYMARVAFVMDKLLRKIGLSGKSFVPMIIGFGCSVPAIMATRTLPSARDRKMTLLLTPFMSCSAKIPIYAIFTAAFFKEHQALVMISLYLGGMIVGILYGLILSKTKYKGKPVPFVMELPNYRFPSAKSVLMLMWEKAKDFIVKAFTVIFVATIIIWFLQNFDLRLNAVTDSADSILSVIARCLAPVFAPLGFGDWRITTSLIAGFSAKEAVVSTLSVLMHTDTSQLTNVLSSLFENIASVISFLTFTLLYTPCVATIAAVKKETKSGLYAAYVACCQCVIAWVVSLGVYRLALLFV